VYCLTIYKNAVNSTYEIVYAIVVDYSLDIQSWIISVTSKDIGLS
jgi:hypothetical protein